MEIGKGSRIMKDIWAVSTGSYSDYSVLALFEDEADAQAAVDECNAKESYRDARVESFYFYPSGTRPHYEKIFHRSVNISNDGTVDNHQEGDYYSWDMGYKENRPFAAIPRRNNGVGLIVSGTDLQAVNQAFSDNLAEIKVRIAQTGKASL